MADGTTSATTDNQPMRQATWMRRSISAATDLLFPPRCAACGEECDSRAEEPLLCPTCNQNLAIAQRPMCPRCASVCSAADLPQSNCSDCRGRKLLFVAARAIGPYDSALRQAVLKAKHATYGSLAEALGQRLSNVIAQSPFTERPDMVVPVPMHWLKRLGRGLNPAAAIASSLARQLKIPYGGHVLICRRLLRRQATLTPPQRRRNVRGAFCVSHLARVRGQRILLIDDVMTTGATAHEASRALLQAGAAAVFVATVARSSAVP